MAHAGRFFGLRRAFFWLVINRYRIRMCESRRRMNNEISDNNQKIVLKLRVISATIELVKNLQALFVYIDTIYNTIYNKVKEK